MQLYSRMIRRFVLPAFGSLYNRHFSRFYRQLETSQYWDPDRLERYRWHRFRALLDHATSSVPFYRRLFRDSNLKLEDLKDFRDLEKLPILGKEDYQRHGLDQFLSSRVPADQIIQDSTSGTSGRPFAFSIDPPLVASKMARLLRENRWASWEAGERYLRLWGPHDESLAKKLFYDVLMRRTEVSAFTLARDFDGLMSKFHRIRPRIVEAYTSAAVHFARLCRERGAAPPPLESIIVSAETLTPANRALIEENLGGKVYNRYGSREFGNVAHECDQGSLHLNAESFHVEEEEHPEISGAKNLIITLFDNYAMPFLRYRIGDLGRLSDATCGCGRNLPLLARVEGRTTDFFRLASGQLLSFLYFNYFFEQYGGVIDQYQVEQLSEDLLQVRLLAGKEFGEPALAEIRQRLDAEFDGAPGFEVVVADELVRGASGKQQIYMPLTKPS